MTIVPASRKEKGVIKRVYPKTSDRAVNLSDGRKLTEFVEEINQNKKSIEDINSTITSINMDTFSPVITQTTAIGKIGKDDTIDVSANVNDGFFKSAILKGNTVIDKRKITWSGGKYLNHETGTVDTGGDVSISHRYCEDYFVCKPSDIITFIGKSSYKKIVFYDENKTYINGHTSGTISTNFTVTSPTNSKYFRIGCFLSGSIETASIEINYVKTMGTDIDGEDKLISVKSPVLTTYTNLFTGFITKGYIHDGEHRGEATDPNLLSDYIEIFAEHLAFRRFKKDGTPVNSFGEFAFYDANKNFIDRRIGKQSVNESVTVPKNTKYIRIWSRPTDNGIDEIAMLIHSNENPLLITTYKPHKTNILTTPPDLELRGIGDLKDSFDLMTGKLTQRIKEVILNGETAANGYTSVDSYIGKYAGHLSTLVDGKNEKLYLQGFVGNIGNSKHYILTNGFVQYKGFKPDNSELEEGLYRFRGSDHAYICISASRFTEHTLDGIKKFLSENPQSYLVTNAEPTVKTIPINGEPLGFKDGDIMLSSGAEGDSLIPTLEYSVPVSKSAQITQNSSIAVNHAKQIYSLEMLLMTSSIEDAYQRLLLQNDVELTRSISDNLEPNPLRYVMLSKIIEEKSYDELDMLDKLDVFLLYNEITLEQYIELTDLILVVDTEVLE